MYTKHAGDFAHRVILRMFMF
eukprot:SAG31_NODE_25406_length_462_cov_0.694215_1_plen_20_part_10